MSNTLYLVSTPIGNLEDITLRALRVLKEVNLIACEDTRVTQKLLNHFEIKTPTTAFHAHSPSSKRKNLLDRIQQGEDIALVSDAGTPIVSDPGSSLVQDAVLLDIQVVPIPGPSSVLAALVSSALPSVSWTFLGFLPRNKKAQTEALKKVKSLESTLVLFESPHRTESTIRLCTEVLGPRQVCVAREVTKKFETFYRGTFEEVLKALPQPLKGEVVILIAPNERRDEPEKATEQQMLLSAKELLDSGASSTDVAKAMSHLYGLKRKAAYQLVLKAKSKDSHA